MEEDEQSTHSCSLLDVVRVLNVRNSFPHRPPLMTYLNTVRTIDSLQKKDCPLGEMQIATHPSALRTHIYTTGK